MKSKLTTLPVLLISIGAMAQTKPLAKFTAEKMPLINNYDTSTTSLQFYNSVNWRVKIDTIPCYMQVLYILGDKKDPIITTAWKSGYEIKRSDSYYVTYLNDLKEPVKNKVLISTEK